MSLHTDIPTRAEIEGLLNARNPASISIYLPTTPVTPDAQADRIAFKNLVSQAVAALPDDLPRGHAAAIDEELTDLQEDDAFWALQANSLAVFATADRVRTFRLPNQLSAAVQVGDRFLVKPLLRTVTFPQAAFVLALAQGSVRLLEVDPGMPAAEVRAGPAQRCRERRRQAFDHRPLRQRGDPGPRARRSSCASTPAPWTAPCAASSPGWTSR